MPVIERITTYHGKQVTKPEYLCEGCGGMARFGQREGKRVLYYCGLIDGKPACVATTKTRPYVSSAPSGTAETLK